MSQKIVILGALAAGLASAAPVRAFDIGLEAEIRVETSDNVGGANEGLEEDGQFGFASFEVFGEQRGRLVQAGFSGELETQRLLSDEDSDLTTLNNFSGAANVTLSPTFSWYFGDVLGTIRTGDDFVPLDDDELSTRRLVTGQFEWRQDTRGGNTFGVDISDFFADEPSSSDGFDANFDSNRFSASVFWERIRGRISWFGSIGATRFDVDDDTINGANAEFRVTRQFTPESSLIFSIGTDLSDSNISTIDSLLSDGVGIEPEASGVFQLNQASIIYDFNASGNAIQVGGRVEDAQFELLTLDDASDDPSLQDNLTLSVFGTLSRQLARRWSLDANLLLENQTFDNLPDDLNGVTGSVSLNFQINRSFSLNGGFRTAFSEGIDTQQSIPGVGDDGEFNITETRATLGLRWAPPSRASREPVVQLRQLLR